MSMLGGNEELMKANINLRIMTIEEEENKYVWKSDRRYQYGMNVCMSYVNIIIY